MFLIQEAAVSLFLLYRSSDDDDNNDDDVDDNTKRAISWLWLCRRVRVSTLRT